MKHIDKAHFLINSAFDFENIKRFDRIYPFTNENIKEIFNYFNFKGKDCLSVLSSSDQILDMHLKGANNITAFDINPLTYYYYELKKAAILSGISFEEYENFFCKIKYKFNIFNNRNAFDIEIYKHISEYITDNKSKIFWDELFNTYKPKKIRQPSALFSADEYSHKILKNNIFYFNEESYKKLQNIIENLNIEFINCNINELNNIDKKFDYIYLSNIFQFVKNFDKAKKNDIEYLKSIKSFIEQLSKNLNIYGEIMICYLYYTNITTLPLCNESARKFVFKEDCFETLKIKNNLDNGKETNNNNHGALIYRKID
ncbi:MAG: class I SAM-dependent methyltransferase [bacterium]|nr:class I SAM-dependent methyltransferase [bacterium]